MNIENIKQKLSENGWKNHSINELPDYNLYKNIELYLYYKNKLTLHFHPKENMIRIMIYNKYNGDIDFPEAFIKIVESNNVVCFEFEYANKIDELIDKIIETQDNLKADDYFTHYLEFQSVCSVSILAVEQFLPGYR